MRQRGSEAALTGATRDDTQPEQSYRSLNLNRDLKQSKQRQQLPIRFGCQPHTHRPEPELVPATQEQEGKQSKAGGKHVVPLPSSGGRPGEILQLLRLPYSESGANSQAQVAEPLLVEQTGKKREGRRGGAVAGEKRRGWCALGSGHGQAGGGGPGSGMFPPREEGSGGVIGVAPRISTRVARRASPSVRGCVLRLCTVLARARRPRFSSRDARAGARGTRRPPMFRPWVGPEPDAARCTH